MSTSAALVLLAPLPSAGDPPCDLVPEPIENTSSSSVFGQRVALEGETGVVSVVPGEARVFARGGAGWTEVGVLSFSSSATSLSLSGDTVFVGVASDDELAENAGAVYVFERAGGSWSFDTKLLAADGGAAEAFGHAVKVDGERAFVGAPSHGPQGSVYVFERTLGVWNESAQLVPDGPTPESSFGNSLDVSGDTLVVGTNFFGSRAYVFVDEGEGWEQQATLSAPNNVVDGGMRVTVSGDTAVVSASDHGAIVYVRDADVWSEEARLFETDGHGIDVELDGDVLVLGRKRMALGGGVDSAALLVRANGTWSLLAELTIEVPFTPLPDQRPLDLAFSDPFVLFGSSRLTSPGVVEAYELPTFVAPSVAHRNAGTNPDSYTSTPAYVGQSLHFTVDLTTTGHDQALVIGFDSPFGLTLGGGQTLLCFDLMGSGGELINTGFHPGPVAEIDLPVPNDLAYAGFSVCTQAVHVFGITPFALSNAQDIVLGACFR